MQQIINIWYDITWIYIREKKIRVHIDNYFCGSISMILFQCIWDLVVAFGKFALCLIFIPWEAFCLFSLIVAKLFFFTGSLSYYGVYSLPWSLFSFLQFSGGLFGLIKYFSLILLFLFYSFLKLYTCNIF